MTFDVASAQALDYAPCRYGTSKLVFRGPRVTLNKPYIAVLGGTETYGKCVADPFADLLSDLLGRTCVNLGCLNAGIDAFVQDADIVQIVGNAQVTVLQVLGAHNLSSRFYKVHPRRNDRFVAPTPLLRSVYRNVDFTQFHFTKHMLTVLREICPHRFAAIRSELQKAWLSRMRQLIGKADGPVVLLWLRHHRKSPLGAEPHFVTRDMVNQLKPRLAGVLELPVCAAGPAGESQEMLFGPFEAPLAADLLGPATHREIARTLSKQLRQIGL